tara:strand:+ start:2298 stop:2555 length:258 start_codon:yes stop_codon:yes gene_type:complete
MTNAKKLKAGDKITEKDYRTKAMELPSKNINGKNYKTSYLKVNKDGSISVKSTKEGTHITQFGEVKDNPKQKLQDKKAGKKQKHA